MKSHVDEYINSWTFANFHARQPIFLRGAISIIRRLLVHRARGNPLEFHREKWSSGWRKLCKVILNFARDICELRPSFLVPANDKRLSLK